MGYLVRKTHFLIIIFFNPIRKTVFFNYIFCNFLIQYFLKSLPLGQKDFPIRKYCIRKLQKNIIKKNGFSYGIKKYDY